MTQGTGISSGLGTEQKWLKPERICLLLLIVGVFFSLSRRTSEPGLPGLELHAQPLSGTAPFRLVASAEISGFPSVQNQYLEWRMGNQVLKERSPVLTQTLQKPGIFPLSVSLKAGNGIIQSRTLTIRVLSPPHSQSAALESQPVLNQEDQHTPSVLSIPGQALWDMEFFELSGRRFIATANHENGRTNRVPSKIYELKEKGLFPFQDLSGVGATDIEVFSIPGPSFGNFLAIANDGADYSSIFRWNGFEFELAQNLPSASARDVKFFSIGDQNFLAIANHHDRIDPVTDSFLYRWDGTSFRPFQKLPTQGAMEFRHISAANSHFLVVANYSDGIGYDVDSPVYQWVGNRFKVVQMIPGRATVELDSFRFKDRSYLVVGNQQPSQASSNLDIYSLERGRFELVESLDFPGLSCLRVLEEGERVFVALGANSQNHKGSILLEWSPSGTRTIGNLPSRSSDVMNSFKRGEITYLSTATASVSGIEDAPSRVYLLSDLL